MTTPTQTKEKPQTKSQTVLAALMAGRSYTRFEAERELHDHCLHSTVAYLERRYRVRINRKRVMVPGYLGSPTSCCRYWIDPDERKRIEKIKKELYQISSGIKEVRQANDLVNEELQKFEVAMRRANG